MIIQRCEHAISRKFAAALSAIAIGLIFMPGIAHADSITAGHAVPSSSSNPIGYLDAAVGGTGTVTVTGWAFDPDNSNASIEVHVYIGNERHRGIIANLQRDDVNRAFGVSGKHGFKAVITTDERGPVQVCAYGINIKSGYDSRLTNTLTTTVAHSIVTMYRLYNPWSGEHLYTQDKNEYDKLGKIGWKQEGEAWKSFTDTGNKVYRLYNKYSGDHHYTANWDEYDFLGTIGWTQEGVAFRSAGSRFVYRGFNPYVTVGTHHYTINKTEMETMVRNGWRSEGVGWYCTS